MTTLTFTDAVPDSVPETSDVEYPCRNCGREAGPYRGRGRKPTLCADCKPQRAKSSGIKVTGSAASQAAQASEVLTQLNAMIAMGAAAMGLFQTAGSIAEYQETFKAQAYAALSTDTALCQLILKSGTKSAKLSLAMAYGGMAVAVGPVAVMEMKERKAERMARKLEAENEAGT